MPSEKSQRGFTLASLMVILTILAVLLAYTVPRMWSDTMKRERDIQTVWVVKQYARAIAEFQRKRGGAMPVSIEQLEEQTTPRIIRQLYPNPLTGEMDWILLPPTTVSGQAVQTGGVPQGTVPGQPAPNPLNPPATGLSGDYKGPFIGVRPPNTGKAYVSLNGSDQYENWIYTINDLKQEMDFRFGGQPGGPNVGVGGVPRTAPPPPPKKP
jgi:type II secretory pathway pseudopilin PulG